MTAGISTPPRTAALVVAAVLLGVGPGYTVANYLRGKGIQQTMVKRGEPGVPQLNLPIPPGWPARPW
jgi:hypothetical protein